MSPLVHIFYMAKKCKQNWLSCPHIKSYLFTWFTNTVIHTCYHYHLILDTLLTYIEKSSFRSGSFKHTHTHWNVVHIFFNQLTNAEQKLCVPPQTRATCQLSKIFNGNRIQTGKGTHVHTKGRKSVHTT